MKSKTPKKELPDIIKRLKEEILPLFDKVISNNNIVFPNPHLVNCRKVMSCKAADCPVHEPRLEKKTMRCWQIAGTFCGGEPQGAFVQKHGDCSKCEVFKESCPTIVEEIGEYFNNMVFLLNRQNHKINEDKDRIEQLNEKLISTIEQLNLKDKAFSEMMITDRLTGLFDRQHLTSVLEDEIARCNRYGHSLALMMIEIDGFKSFNKIYGYSAGDKMLSYAGTLIKKNIRKFDKAFRYSSKEFIVVLPETDLTLAYIVAERIRKAFESKTFTVSVKEDTSKDKASRTFSIGMASAFNYTTNNIGAEDLIRQTGKAVTEAKDKGGNMCIRHE